jgi:hypothetical protein
VDARKLLGPIATALAPQRAPDYKPRASLVELATTGVASSPADEADAVILLAGVGVKGPFKGQLTMTSPAEHEKAVFACVDRWVQLHGTTGAFEIFTYVGRWKPYDLYTHGHTLSTAMRRLRQWLAHAEDYDGTLALAMKASKQLGDALPQYTRGEYQGGAEVLSYLFPDHRPFFDAAAKQAVAQQWPTLRLVASITTRAEYERIAETINFADWDANATAFARALGDEALPILAGLASELSTTLGIAEALTAFDAPEAAAALTHFLRHKPAHKLLASYFARYRELAPKALERHRTSSQKLVREAAVKLLA